jgi:hypothetical protein
MRQLCRERSCSYPGRSVRLCAREYTGALLAAMSEVTGQKSADGIVVDSYRMKRRPEAKGENFPRCSVLSLGRPALVRCDRRDGGSEILMVDQNGSPLVDLSDYGSTLLVTARCGPACWVVWEGGDKIPCLSLLVPNPGNLEQNGKDFNEAAQKNPYPQSGDPRLGSCDPTEATLR